MFALIFKSFIRFISKISNPLVIGIFGTGYISYGTVAFIVPMIMMGFFNRCRTSKKHYKDYKSYNSTAMGIFTFKCQQGKFYILQNVNVTDYCQ
jgi:hypothetical protein